MFEDYMRYLDPRISSDGLIQEKGIITAYSVYPALLRGGRRMQI